MKEIVRKIISISGRNPFLCYQCGLCSAVCPVVEYMDTPPHKVVKLIQLGGEELKRIKSIWYCISCMACVDRCPRNVGPGILFEAFRLLTLRRGIDKVDLGTLENIDKVPTIAVVALARKTTG
ncbi:MAG: heterodisulfide reductase [Thermoprotei archaeon]|nr:MAG: heterodisulfide reductase [Thermoprotei archaeon]RLE88686.1 MAG: heterodisulfide reductase [Thermoprotei archaeon]